MRSLTRSLILVFLLAAIVPFAVSQEGDKTKSPPPCSAAEHRQFDFWIGEWEVTANDKIAGTNTITALLNGCVIHEDWASTSGYKGESFNRYDPATSKWRQVWVDNQGGVLDLEGEYKDGKMIMAGKSVNKKGDTVFNRITWHNNAGDGTVRQVWDQSSDNGATWTTVFDGLYAKKKK